VFFAAAEMVAQALVAAQRGGIEGSSKFFQSMFIQGYCGLCVFLLPAVRGKVWQWLGGNKIYEPMVDKKHEHF
jgi:hypothetical protein